MGVLRKFDYGKGKFFVCIDHRLVLDNPNCPHDPCRKNQSPLQPNCQIASEFATRTKAERWLCKLDAQTIEAIVDDELAAIAKGMK